MTAGGKKRNTERLSGLSKGFPTGLRWTLFFLLCFFLLGYSAILSILLSVLGGTAVSLLIDWWNSKDEIIEQSNPPDAIPVEPDEPGDDIWEKRREERRRRHKPKGLWPF